MCILQTQTSQTKVTTPPRIAQDEDEDLASDDTADNTDPLDVTDQVISQLKRADYSPVVGIDYANTKLGAETDGGHVSAFAKLAGQDWTYYVQKTSIKIGRPPDSRSRSGEADSPPRINSHEEEDPDVHIDLGPSKHISRLHAEVYYDSTDFQWYLVVTGRNGARLNDRLLKRGDQASLESGVVIEIAGTEMMFVTADDQENIHAKYLARINWPGLDEENEESDMGGRLHSHPRPATVDHPPPLAQAPTWASHNTSMPLPLKQSRPSTPVQSPRLEHNYLLPNDGDSAAASSLPRKPNGEIDYSVDAARNIKPPCSYATLIAQAILSTPEKALALAGIYDWIKENFSYYRFIEQTWQVRNNLPWSRRFQGLIPLRILFVTIYRLVSLFKR